MESNESKFIPAEEESERLEREQIRREPGSINELLHYDVRESDIYLHVAPARTLPLETKLRLFREGFHILAEKLKTDPELRGIKNIIGESWIAREHPELLQKLGFTVGDFELTEDGILEYNTSIAQISRDEFIKRYSPS